MRCQSHPEFAHQIPAQSHRISTAKRSQIILELPDVPQVYGINGEHLHVRTVGIRAVNIRKSMQKKRQPALL